MRRIVAHLDLWTNGLNIHENGKNDNVSDNDNHEVVKTLFDMMESFASKLVQIENNIWKCIQIRHIENISEQKWIIIIKITNEYYRKIDKFKIIWMKVKIQIVTNSKECWEYSLGKYCILWIFAFPVGPVVCLSVKAISLVINVSHLSQINK